MLGLQNIVLSNSIYRSKIVQIEVNGHTNLSGGNGAGKTSSLNLVPVFYGTDPNRLVLRVAGKVSFLDYYLPQQSSALIFEYLRDDGPRLAVLHRHASGSKHIYRFIAGGFEETFLIPSIKALVESGAGMGDVLRAISSLGFDVSRQVDTIIDYRAIIQHDKKLLQRHGRGKNTERELAYQFCLGGRNSYMSNLDAMAYSVLSRKDMFDRFKTMIAETQFNELYIEERSDMLKDKSLREDIASIRTFTQSENAIRGCIASYYDREDLLSQRDSVAGQLKSRLLEAHQTCDELAIMIRENEDQINQHELQYHSQSMALREQENVLSSRVRHLEGEINAIQDERERFDEIDIPQMRADYAQLKSYRSELSQLEQFYADITKQVQDLASEKQQSIARVREVRDEIRSDIDKQRTELSVKREQITKQFEALIEKVRKQREDALEKYNDDHLKEYQRRAEQLTVVQQNALSSSFTDEEIQTINDLEARRDLLDEQRNSTELEVATERKLYHDASDKRDGIIEVRRDHESQRQRLQADIERITKLITPSKNSFLAALREHNPDWTETIGKVIPAEILAREDLEPVLDDSGSDVRLFGWEIALHKLDKPEFALEISQLEESLRGLEIKLAAVEDKLDDLRNQEAQIFEYMSQREKALRILERRAHTQKELWTAIYTEIKDKNAEAKRAVRKRQEGYRKEADALKLALSRFEKDSEVEKQQLKHNFDQGVLEHKTNCAADLGDLDTHSAHLVERREEADELCKEKEDEIQEVFEQRCTEEGVEPAKIRQAEENVKQQEALIKKVSGYLHTLEEYDHFEKHRLSQLSDLQSELTSKSTELQTLQTKLVQLKSEYQAITKRLTQEKDQANSRFKELTTLIEQGQYQIKRCPGTVNATELETGTGSLEHLIKQIQSILDSEYKKRNEVFNGIASVQRILNTFINSKIYRAWDYLVGQRQSRMGISESDDEFRLSQPLDLETLLNTELPTIRDGLLEQVRAVGDNLSKYHTILDGLNKEVARVSRHLGREVNTGNPFDEISDISFELTSVIVEGDYWSALTAFNQQWKSWRESRSEILPPDALLDSLYRANELLSQAKIGKNIDSLLRLTIHLNENGRNARIASQRDMENASSNGLSYLAILVIFMGMTRYLCPNDAIKLHWSIDEFANLSLPNIAKVFEMLTEKGIYCYSAFPTSDPNILQHFDHKYLINVKEGVRQFKDQVVKTDNPFLAQSNQLMVEG